MFEQCGIFGFSLYQKEDFENAKGVIRIRISKKNWQHNGQKDKQRSSKIVLSPPWLGWPLGKICVTYYHGYVPLVISTSRPFPHSWLITVFLLVFGNVWTMWYFWVFVLSERRFWKCQRDNQNSYIEEELTTQWPKGQTTIYKTYT
jgi:hypothetical protein